MKTNLCSRPARRVAGATNPTGKIANSQKDVFSANHTSLGIKLNTVVGTDFRQS